MSTRNNSKLRGFPALVALLAAGAGAAQGCGGDDNPVPTPVVVGGSGGTGNGGNAGKGGKGNTGGSGDTGGTGGTGVSGEGGQGNEGSGATAGTGTGGKAGASATGGSSGKGGTGSGGKAGSGGKGGGAGSAGKGGSGGTSSEVDCNERPDGCYRCDPQAVDPAPAFPHSPNEQFLNRCSDARGWPFDNATRIPNFPGTDNLPTLP